VVEALVRVTPAQRQNAALAALGEAAEAFSDGQYHVAVKKADHAKDLASRDATIREVLGLASYRVGDWATALRELRTYRRLSGETTHMPVEMDTLRALGRDKDVGAVWEEFRKLGGGPAAKKEARVVYASFLVDQGDLAGAADIAGNPKIAADPWPEDLRLWYVAARIAAMQGQRDRAKRIADAIVLEDPGFPGLDELDRLIEGR
jgi:Flp pilus assembly protein TadD